LDSHSTWLTSRCKDQILYDVKFYPLSAVDDDQIFAVMGNQDLFVVRPKFDEEQPFEVLRWLRDVDVRPPAERVA